MRDDAVLEWLLQGDPAIRWQALRDLAGRSTTVVERERRRVARSGWGSRLLALQNPGGTWGAGKTTDGLYTPKWISTTYTMLLLRDFGLGPNNRQAHLACQRLLDGGMQPDGGLNYGTWAKWSRTGETCITGMVLSLLAYFQYDDPRVDTIVQHLLDQQMSDGGWNCRRAQGATHSSVHTTISVLEGLALYERQGNARSRPIRAAQRHGREFLLVHRLFRSHRTGEVIKPVFLRFAFPPRWHYDVLRGLDHFQAVNAPRDARLAEGIGVIEKSRLPDGRWPLQHTFPGKTHFEMERRGAPSRWNTLRALRVLQWWYREKAC